MVDPPRQQVTSDPLLETKLHVPRRRRGLVARPRLAERLSRGAEAKLTLVSAPAGFGKTTLLAECLADAREPRRLACGRPCTARSTAPATQTDRAVQHQ